MKWSFTKMQGAGNDFVMLDGVSQDITMTAERAFALADRRFGIGADQILLVEPSERDDADFKYRIFNADGSEVEHCGNGARCFVRFVHAQQLSDRNPLRAEIATGLIVLTENPDETVNVDMGQVSFAPEDAGFDCSGLQGTQQGEEQLWQFPLASGKTVPLAALSISNPHAIIEVKDADSAPVERVGALIESHPRFKNRVNVSFMQVLDPQHIRLRVYERGAGETLACGTGACASVVSGIRRGLLKSPVNVQARGGNLRIYWDGSTLTLQGPARISYQGTVDVDALVAQNPILQNKV